jgi:hypothetical protein
MIKCFRCNKFGYFANKCKEGDHAIETNDKHSRSDEANEGTDGNESGVQLLMAAYEADNLEDDGGFSSFLQRGEKQTNGNQMDYRSAYVSYAVAVV